MIYTSSNLEILIEMEKSYYFLQIYLILKVDIQILFCILYYLVFILKISLSLHY